MLIRWICRAFNNFVNSIYHHYDDDDDDDDDDDLHQ